MALDTTIGHLLDRIYIRSSRAIKAIDADCKVEFDQNNIK